MQAAVAHVVEITIRGLEAVDKGLSGSLVAPPGILRPLPHALGLLGRHAAHLVVEKRHHVAETEETELADDPVDGERGADLQGAGAGSVPVLEHFLRIAVFLEAGPTRLAAVGLGNSL